MRRYFDARIEEEVERSKRYGTPFSVLMMDVDNFKKLNDEHGHLIGDRVLKVIANVVKAQMRGVDTAARYGGEEIAMILPRTDMLNAYNVGERIRIAIAEQRVTTDSEPPKVLGVTASFGIASYPETKAANGEDLVRRADRALYRAKKTGKNRVELFWSDDTGPARIHTPDPDAVQVPKLERSSKVEKHERSGVTSVDRSSKVEKVDRSAKVEKVDRSAKVEKVEPSPEWPIEKIDRSSKVEKLDPVEVPIAAPIVPQRATVKIDRSKLKLDPPEEETK
jgi:diguanylate cyclase (GGDEF)-like protein